MQVCVIYSNPTVSRFKDTQKEKYNKDLELVSKRINVNSRLKKMVVFTLGSLLYLEDAVYASDFSKIDTGGNKILEITRHIGYWACLIGCTIEIIRSMMQGDSKSIGKTIAKYAVSYGALYLLPWILDLIKSIFA